MCRKKKIKCDGKMPKCSHCINYKTECIFTQVEKKRNPPKGYDPVGPQDGRIKHADLCRSAKYIEGLENRLGRMEALLRLSGLLTDEDSGKTDLGTLEKRLSDKNATGGGPFNKSLHKGSPIPSNSTSSQYDTPRADLHSSPRSGSSGSPKEQEDEIEDISDMMCSLVTNSCGETRYIGGYCCC